MPVSEIVFAEGAETFRAFATASSERIPLFHQPWWLDLTSPNSSWSAITATADGVVVGYLVFRPKLLLGFRAVIQPEEGFFAGPFFPQSEGGSNLKPEDQRRIIEGFAAALENYTIYRQYWHHSVRDWSPFYWRGYRQTTRYTYQLNNTPDLEATFAAFSGNIRRLIRKAQGSAETRWDDSVPVNEYLELNRVTYSRQGERYPHNDKILQPLFAAGLRKNLVKILGVRNRDGQLVAANVYGIDALCVYYLQGASTDWGRRSGAVALCFWEGVRLSASSGLPFDFEGSMLRGVEKYVRTYGAEQVEYYAVSRLRLPWVPSVGRVVKRALRRVL